MKTAIITTVIAGVLVITAFAADSSTGIPERNLSAAGMEANPQGQGMTITQKKTEILQHIEQRIANSQLEKTCVQAAESHDALRACREKYRPQPQGDRQGGGRRP